MQIYKGMFRKPWEEIPRTSLECACGQILLNQEATRQHWQDGHFDTPVYAEVPLTN